MPGPFGGGIQGPCPVCGAAEMSCGGGGDYPRGVIGAGFFLAGTQPHDAVARFRSREAVYADDGLGHTVQVYGIGSPVPLIEALRQGLATWEGLDRADAEALARHGVRPPAAAPPTPQHPAQPPHQEAPAPASDAEQSKGKARPRPEKDKMVREGQVVQK